MCHDPDSSPPITPIPGAVAEAGDLILTAGDGNEFAAYSATSSESRGPGVVILPDVRGLYKFYEELADRLAENGYDAIAFDYFGRTAGVGRRGDEFPYTEHVPLTTTEGIAADTAAVVGKLREGHPNRAVFTIGFCFGGSGSWHQAAEGHGLSGAIGFYGNPKRPPVGPIERVSDFECPILALMAGQDQGIPVEVIGEYEQALSAADVKHEVVIYPDAEHSFFDRKQDRFGSEAIDAWQRVLGFLIENA
jgi:carboxymethylenebutenolidase